MEGVTMAKALAISLDIPLISVNHLKGHIFSTWIEKQDELPCTILLVSGGHTQIIEATNLNDMKIVGQTSDDSFGESFDKVAKMLNLGYPGGPIIQKYALNGDENAYTLPIPLRQSPKIEFSYSGLKNAVRLIILDEQEKANGEELSQKVISNICASFQKTAVDHIIMKLKKYFKSAPLKKLAIVGGASANIYLRENIQELCNKHNAKLILAPLEFCSDNAAMIGRVAVEQYKNNEFSNINNMEVQSRLKSF
jgi:N6-L-threonylcarbamoyladenine synthase